MIKSKMMIVKVTSLQISIKISTINTVCGSRKDINQSVGFDKITSINMKLLLALFAVIATSIAYPDPEPKALAEPEPEATFDLEPGPLTSGK